MSLELENTFEPTTMKLRTRLNLVVTGLTVAFVLVLLTSQIQSTRVSVREEIAAANLVAAQVLRPLASTLAENGQRDRLLQYLDELGRVRANEITLQTDRGQILYRSPPSTYKAGREAPAWFAQLFSPAVAKQTFHLGADMELLVEANSSRAVLDAWDDVIRLLTIAAIMLLIANMLAFWTIERALKPFPVIVHGLQRIEGGDLGFRLPQLAGFEARAIGAAFNRMARAVEDKVQAERKVREAEARLDERRELAQLVDQRIEEERRLIAHELHDEFGQSVTAIRSLAMAITAQATPRDPSTADTARLIADEAARLYDAMHGLIPRLAPLALDTLGLAEILDSLVRDWQRRYRSAALSLQHDLPGELGPSITLAIYRVVQEGLINALRHAQPSRVEIAVRADADRIVAIVKDDGVGLPAEWARPGHFGLRGLAQRVEHLGGRFDVRNAESRGVLLTAEIPLAVKT